MRQHRVLRNTSTQSLPVCIFCRIAGQVAPATAPRRRLLHHTRRTTQQATAHAPQHDSAPQEPSWTFDSNSALSPSEQREKWNRQQKRRELLEREAAEAKRVRDEEDRRNQERQIRELQEREAAGKARREEEARRREAQDRQRDARAQQSPQRLDNRARDGGQAQRPQQHANRQQQQGHGQRSPNAGRNAGAAAANAQTERRPGRDQRTSNHLFGGKQVQQKPRPSVTNDSRDVRASQSLFDRPQVPQVQPSQPQRTHNKQRAPEPTAQRLQRPTFVESRQAEEAPTGWGMGGASIKPLQPKTDEQIRGEREAEVEKAKQVQRERNAEVRRAQEARRKEIDDQIQQRREREQAAAETRRPRPAAQDQGWGTKSQGNSPPPPPPSPRPRSSPAKPAWDAEGEYQATPLRSIDYSPSSNPTTERTWENTWHHLTPKRDEQAAAAPPQRDTNLRNQPYRRPLEDDSTIDRNFQEHKRRRDMRAPDPFSNSNITDAPRQKEIQSIPRTELRCFRCLEFGHRARDCENPMKCSNCGAIGHNERTCRAPRTSGQKPTPRRGALGEQRAGMREPGNIFRRTQVGGLEEVQEGGAVADQRKESSFYRSTHGSARPFDARETETQPRRALAYEAEREDSKKSEPAMRQRSDVEEDAEQDAYEDRRARRRSRGFADEEVEEASTPKSFERRKEGRASRRRESDEDADDEALAAREERAARKVAKKAQEKAEQEKRKAARAAGERYGGGTQVQLPEFVSVSNLAQQLGIPYEPFVQRLEQLGYDDVFPGKVLNRETSGMIAMEYDFDPVYEGVGSGARSEEEDRDLKAAPEVEDTTFLPTRPPLVTIMGHVDHGKTTILDYLRRTSVAAGEAGGITQHIGAFSVPLSASGRTITFLDTPGHAAFMSMRQRGANVTDIVILVVAADDSVKPQTLESIRCAREAGVPMIVAVNKVDKPEADVQRVKNDLSRHGVEIEDFGGEVQVVEVSGKTGQGLDALEENVVTLSEILDHRSDTDGDVEGWVLEATTKRAGRVATVLVKRGTLRPGAILVAGKTWARVRTLRDERDQNLMEVGPGMPVEVDGWRDQPVAGDQVLQAPGEQKATDVVAYRLEKGERVKMEEDMEAINEARRAEQERRKAAEKAAKAAKAATEAGEDGSAATVAQSTAERAQEPTGQQVVPFIIKADVSGSAEAVAAYIPSLTSPLIAPDILTSTVGAINESDVELASASGGHIVAFNLPKNEEMRGLAESKGVQVLENNIIYRTLEQVKEVLEARLPQIVTTRVVGEAEVGVVFEIGVGGRRKLRIAGCKVRNGAVARNARVRVLRDGDTVYSGTITSLKNVKKDVQEMRKGTECGMGFDGWEGFREGDQVQTFEEIREKRTL